jgi:hypothetical protein
MDHSMKQQVSPATAAAAIVGALVVVGLVIYLINHRPPAKPVPTGKPVTNVIRNVSPDEVVKRHMQQMQQGGGAGQ